MVLKERIFDISALLYFFKLQPIYTYNIFAWARLSALCILRAKIALDFFRDI